jgi:signal transduction histidine kinase
MEALSHLSYSREGRWYCRAPSLPPFARVAVSTQAEFSRVQPPAFPAAAVTPQWRSARFLAGVLLLAAAYYGAAKLGQTLRYTASVSAIWPPAGVGIAALYLWGIRWWPGLLLGEFVVNGELLLDDTALPLGSLVGQQTGNMAEMIVGALLLRRFIGSRAALDRADQVGGMVTALVIGVAISATVGTLSMFGGGVIDESEMAKFWRTWFLGDFAGTLVVVPAALAWFQRPPEGLRQIRSWEGGLLIASVVVLAVIAVTIDESVTYVAFPALIWAAFRFGLRGATLAIAIVAGAAIGITAHDVGPFFKQPIDDRTLSTQVYIVVTALTTLFLCAVVSERARSAAALAEAKRREDERAVEERHRIARDLHDSVSQALFSTNLHTRTAQKEIAREDVSPSEPLAQALSAIAELTKGAQSEMRALISELGRDPVEDGLVVALTRHARTLAAQDGVAIHVESTDGGLAVDPHVATQLFGIGREALANVARHAGASTAWVRIEAPPGRAVVEISDDGSGFDTTIRHPGHFGLESMRSRAAEVGALLTITSTPGQGTVVRVDAPARSEGLASGA